MFPQLGSPSIRRILVARRPEHRVTDDRINRTLYTPHEIIEGGLDRLIEPVARKDQAERLAG